MSTTHDYILIGSGAAGGVLAHRLSEDPAIRVLLLEAGGPDDDPAIPRVDVLSLLQIWKPELDWGFSTEPEPGLLGRRIPILQGRVLGGGTSINARIYLRGNRKDYDHWNHLGNEGWSYEEVLPYFRRSEDYPGGPSRYHGAGGPMGVAELDRPTEAARTFVEAAVERGFGGTPWDFNGERQEGAAGLTQSFTTRDGKRAGIAEVFLRPAMARPNLTVETRATVTRILFEKNRAVGVEYRRNGESHTARASAEVILSAGALSSPKLLMLSGVGPADHLRSHGIDVLLDLPGVGENLQDHVLARLCFGARRAQTVPTVMSEATLFTHTRGDLRAASPNLQFFFGGFVFPDVGEPTKGFTVCPVLTQPHGRGTVRLRSGSPGDPPLVRMGYLERETDVRVLVEGFRLAREIVAARAFDRLRGEPLVPATGVTTEREIIEHLRATSISNWHPSCSLRMGHDSMAVVDPRLRVHGLEGLRVVDASVMPRIVNANIAAACVMIGEKAADMILRDR